MQTVQRAVTLPPSSDNGDKVASLGEGKARSLHRKEREEREEKKKKKFRRYMQGANLTEVHWQFRALLIG